MTPDLADRAKKIVKGYLDEKAFIMPKFRCCNSMIKTIQGM